MPSSSSSQLQPPHANATASMSLQPPPATVICYTTKLKEATKINTAAGDDPQQPRDKTGCCSC
nr:protein NRT1/ PTR FAMILY 5.5-like [Ipomoea batatas]